jgi:hypothetical protein
MFHPPSLRFRSLRKTGGSVPPLIGFTYNDHEVNRRKQQLASFLGPESVTNFDRTAAIPSCAEATRASLPSSEQNPQSFLDLLGFTRLDQNLSRSTANRKIKLHSSQLVFSMSQALDAPYPARIRERGSSR